MSDPWTFNVLVFPHGDCRVGHLWWEAIVCMPAWKITNPIDLPSIFARPRLYIKCSCCFSMSLLQITGLQLLFDSHQFKVHHYAWLYTCPISS